MRNRVFVSRPCRDRLPRIDLAADDDAVDGRANDGALQLDLRLVENGLLFLDDRLGVSDVRARHLNVGLRDLDRVGFHFDLRERDAQLRLARVAGGARLADLAVGRRSGARQLEFPLELKVRFVAARLRRLRLRLRRFAFGLSRGDAELRPAQPRPLHFRQRRRNFQRRARPAHPRFESAAVELRERLTRGNRIVEIHKDLVEQAGNGGPHIDLRDGLDGPRRFDRHCDIAPRPTASNTKPPPASSFVAPYGRPTTGIETSMIVAAKRDPFMCGLASVLGLSVTRSPVFRLWRREAPPPFASRREPLGALASGSRCVTAAGNRRRRIARRSLDCFEFCGCVPA